MPSIPPTRRKLLKRPDQDNIQWTLTNHNEKTMCNLVPKSSPINATVTTTLDIAKKFINLLNSSSNVRSIHETRSFLLIFFLGTR